ncbi:MAG: tyrosine--tRNA ligase [Mycoplasmataceae bacterium]|nr:tyrosine--tRNA ligase [Mycoplasmataceae bacterium]
MTLLEDLRWRGLINNITNEQKFINFINQKGTAYIGFDPSADSLHLGNYITLITLRRIKAYGCHAIAIIGGATGQIGDPSGKTSERIMQEAKTISLNALAIEKQIKKYGQVDEIINNLEIYKDMSFFDFLRSAGKLINVNYLLEKDIIKSRLETGISYTEFSYNLIQGYDFAWLYTHKNVTVQMGGSDQWGNITTGIEMIRKLVGDNNNACGVTFNLLTKSDGTKFGKSESGAIYLDQKKTPSFSMYQFLFNQPDEQLEMLFKHLTFLTKDEIEDILKLHRQDCTKRIGQKKLAELIIGDIHGNDEYAKCLKIASAFFNSTLDKLNEQELLEAFSTIQSTNVNVKEINILEALIAAKICDSKSEGRKLIEQKAIIINNKPIDNIDYKITKKDAIIQNFVYIKKGKKNYYILQIDVNI